VLPEPGAEEELPEVDGELTEPAELHPAMRAANTRHEPAVRMEDLRFIRCSPYLAEKSRA
jgi:hypothetical protein